jgi:hypothetical protein
VKLGIATVITDEGIRPEVLAKALGNRGFDSIHVTENSHIPASRTTPYRRVASIAAFTGIYG